MMNFNPFVMMGNSPIGQLLNAIKSGGSPNAMIQQLLENHPQRQQLTQLIGGKSPDQIMKTAENMCRERGTSIEEVLKQFGITR